MKFYIFGGCSFTDMSNSWARVITRDLLKEHNCRNVAKSGAGNVFISTATIDCALKAEAEGLTPDINVMWSGPSRIEFPIKKNETPYFNELFESNRRTDSDMNPGLYALTDILGEHDKSDDNWWLLNGGNVSSKTKWSFNKNIDKEFVDAFEKYQMYFSNSNLHWHNTLMSILNLQNLCELKGWKYRFTTFRDYVDEYKTYCAPQFKDIQNAIKWEKFVFTDNNTGGLREYTLNNLNTWDDGYDNHPSYEAHEDFVYNFWLKQFPGVYK